MFSEMRTKAVQGTLVPPNSQYGLLGGYSTVYEGAKAPIVAIVPLDQVWMDIYILSGIILG